MNTAVISNNLASNGSFMQNCVTISLGNNSILSAGNNNIINNKNGTVTGVRIWNISTGTGTQVSLHNNLLKQNFTFAGYGSSLSLLDISGSADSVAVVGNIIDSNYSTTAGNFYGIKINTPFASVLCDSNKITRNYLSGYSGSNQLTCTYINASSYGFTNNLVDNNLISGAEDAETTIGFEGTGALAAETVTNNTISNLSCGLNNSNASTMYGMKLNSSYPGKRVVSGNKIHYLSGPYSRVTGIYSDGPGTTFMFNNKIDSLYGAAKNYIIKGIENAGGSASTYYNNYIGSLWHLANSSNEEDSLTGFALTGGNAVKFYNNTIYIPAGDGIKLSSAGVSVKGNPVFDMRNNIIVNLCKHGSSSGNAVAYYRSAASFTNYNNTSDNNLLYAGIPSSKNLIYYDGTNAAQTLANYQDLVATSDQHSKTENVTFVSIDANNAGYLHINPSVASYAESGGTNIDSIVNDYDNDVRMGNPGYAGTGTAPDMGADEFDGIPGDVTPPVIVYTVLGEATCAGLDVVSATITDASGINTTAGLKPRLYYKKSTDANTFAGNTSSANGWKYVEASNTTSPFSFMADMSLLQTALQHGDIIQYFVIAQDAGATPNVGINSGDFAAAPHSVALTATAFPVSGDINSSTVVAPVYYVDVDHDGFGSTTTAMLCSSTAPVGYSINNTDCNDNDATVHEPQQYYVDADHDGFGSTTTALLCSSTAPVGYSINNTDCNDNDATVHQPQQYYVDNDHDGFGSTTTAMLCSSTAPVGYSINNTDCNDNDATVHEPQQYYVDNDHDGYGSATTAMLCSSTAPVGYSTNNTDCNDNDATVHEPQQYYVDNDHDGYGSTITAMLCSSTAPVGYSTNNTDCNDNNATVHQPQQYYVDNDHDGFGSTTTVMLCSSTAPVGYSINNTDCNDNDATVHGPQLYYVDADHDGYGSTTTVMLCSSTAPVGYSTNNTDCNDRKANIYPKTWYRDADGDGYGDPAASVIACPRPPGYVANKTDCDDSKASMHPGAPEICDGLDNNCNGKIDENCTTISIADNSISEGNTGTCLMNFIVSLNKKSSKQVSVNFTTANVTALAGSDYVAKSGTVTIPAGALSAKIPVTIKGDKTTEPDETFRVNLSNAVNATLAKNYATGTIRNDDLSSISYASTNESELSISLSPNPATSIVNVLLKGYSGMTTINVMSLEGKLLLQKKVQASSVKFMQEPIDISHLASGVYMVIIIDEQGRRKSEKLVVQH